MTALAVVLLAPAATAVYGLSLRARAALVDAAAYGRHAARTGRPTQAHGRRAGWDTGALPVQTPRRLA